MQAYVRATCSNALLRSSGHAIHNVGDRLRHVFPDYVTHNHLVEAAASGCPASDGTLDRARLADRVFGDAAELNALNALVHPAVRRAMHAEIDAARAAGVRLFVYEAALLLEVGAETLVDHVALVVAPEAVRVQRAMGRDGAAEADVRARMARQLGPAEAQRRVEALGGTVVDNGADLDALYAQADALAERLLAPA